MRLISLVLTLVIIGGLLVYYKDALLGPDAPPDQTVREHSTQVIDEAKRATDEMQKQLEQQQKRFDDLENK